jgi:hypothetical protein
MPAIREFPKHTNPAALRAGLVLQAKPEIDCNEYGMEQGTLKFLTFNENLKRLAPKRGTPCSQFKAGDDLTARILRQLDYIGAQTNGKIFGGGSGIGMLEVLCQGAIFAGHSGDIAGVITPASEDDPITAPNNPISSTADTVTVQVFSFQDAGTLKISDVINYHAIDLHFEYMARDKARRPRFLKSEYELDAETGLLIIDDDGASDSMLELLIDSIGVQEESSGAVTLVNPTAEVLDRIENPRNYWQQAIVFAGTGARFEQTPAGSFWHVLETATIKIVPKDNSAPASLAQDVVNSGSGLIG